MTTQSGRQQTPVDPPLRVVRRARGLSLRAVASRAGVDPGHLSKVERGEKQLSVDALHRVAAVLGLRELADLLAPYVPAKEREAS
jgi:transcriptional regulator with XRE-family HTH domain